MLWNLELAKQEARKYKTRTDFQIGSSGAYCFCYKNGLLDIVCAHMPYYVRPKHRVQRKWTLELAKKEAKKYKHRTEFYKNNSAAYAYCRRKGILDEACKHMV